jgi:integrase/recombinase XerC
VVALDYPDDVDLEAGELWVKGKKRVGRERISLPTLTRAALARWVEQRGEEPGPFFTNRDRARKGDGRLSGRGVDQIIKRLGKVVGMKRISYHGLRHAAITYALDVTDGDLRSVQKFSRHRDPRTLMVYDDTRQDHAGRIAELVAQGSAGDDEEG